MTLTVEYFRSNRVTFLSILEMCPCLLRVNEGFLAAPTTKGRRGASFVYWPSPHQGAARNIVLNKRALASMSLKQSGRKFGGIFSKSVVNHHKLETSLKRSIRLQIVQEEKF